MASRLNELKLMSAKMTFAIPLTNKLQSLTKSCHLYSSLITCNFCRRECSLVPVLKDIQKIIGLPPYDVWEHLLPVSECYRTMFNCSALIVTCTCNAAQAYQPHFSCTKNMIQKRNLSIFFLTMYEHNNMMLT